MAETSNWAFDHTNENETPPALSDRCSGCGHTYGVHTRDDTGPCDGDDDYPCDCPHWNAPASVSDRGRTDPDPRPEPVPPAASVRLEALRLAVQRCVPSVHQDTVVTVAREFEKYLTGGSCGCGEPWTLGTVHRAGAPCYIPTGHGETEPVTRPCNCTPPLKPATTPATVPEPAYTNSESVTSCADCGHVHLPNTHTCGAATGFGTCECKRELEDES